MVWRAFCRRVRSVFSFISSKYCGGVWGMNSRIAGWRQGDQLGGCCSNTGPRGWELEP